MNQVIVDQLLHFTEEWSKRPMNVYFLNPVNPEADGIPDYYQIIKKPMDLSTVKNNLVAKKYNTMKDWYQDMCLIYENAINYHKENIWGFNASFLLDEFKKQASIYAISSISEWEQKYISLISQLGDKVSKVPVPLGEDELIASSLKKAENMPPLPGQTIIDMMKKAQNLMQDKQFCYGFLTVLREAQNEVEFKMDDPTVKIELDALSTYTLNALNLFVCGYD